MSLTDSQKDTLVLCSCIFSLVSLVSSMTVIMYFFWFKELRKFAFKLVTLTAVCDAIRCIGNLIGSPTDGPLCQTQGFLKTFGGVASFFWVGCMAFTIQLICTNKVNDPKTLLYSYHFVTWTMASIAAFIPLGFNDYTSLGSWCWIGSKAEGSILRWSSFYGILWFFFVWICYVYISLWWHLKDLPDKSQIPRMVFRLWIYPLVLLICYGPASVRRVWNLVGDPPYWLAVMHICFSCLHGFVNAMAYGRNRDIQALNKHLLDKSIGECFGFRDMPPIGSITSWERQPNTEQDYGRAPNTPTSISEPPAVPVVQKLGGDLGYAGKLKNAHVPSPSNSRIEMTTPTPTPEQSIREEK